MLNFILDTFKKNEKLNGVSLDGVKISKTAFFDANSEFVKVKENSFINLNAVKNIDFTVGRSDEEIDKFNNAMLNLIQS